MKVTLEVIDDNMHRFFEHNYVVFRLNIDSAFVDIKIHYSDDNHLGKIEQLTPIDFHCFYPAAFDFPSAVALISKLSNQALEETDACNFVEALSMCREFEI